MNLFSKLHPFTIFFVFCEIIIISMFINNPFVALISLAGGLLYNFTGKKRGDLSLILKLYLPMMLLIFITNPLFSHSGVTALFYIGGTSVTLESLIYGGSLALTVAAVFIWFRNFNFVFTSDKYLYLFSKKMPKVTLVMSSAIHFIPRLLSQAKKVERAQKAMGLFSGGKYFTRVKAHLRVFSSVVGWSLEHSVETAKSMRARGGEMRDGTNYSVFYFSAKDFSVLLLSSVFFALTLLGAVAGKIAFNFYPKIVFSDLSPLTVLFYAAFAALSLIPFSEEIVGEVKWKYYKSKI